MAIRSVVVEKSCLNGQTADITAESHMLLTRKTFMNKSVPKADIAETASTYQQTCVIYRMNFKKLLIKLKA